MKKIKDWLNKPITWKDSFIAAIIGTIISFLCMAFTLGWHKYIGEKIVDVFDEVKAKIKK